MFARLGRWCFHRRRLVITLWLVALLGLGGLLNVIGTETRSEFELPDGESARGIEIVEEHFDGQGAGGSGSIVFLADAGVRAPEVRTAMEELFDTGETLAADHGIDGLRIVSPYDPEGARQVATSGPLAGRIAYATLEVPSGVTWEETQEIGAELRDAAPDLDGLQVEVGGEMFAEFEPPEVEALGIAFAIIILVFAFGSVLAMGLPIGVGLAGIGVGTSLALVIGHVVTQPDFAQQLGMMIGLGVGIDYALFIVTRFRENRAQGLDIEQSVITAINTAGRAVAFAGVTVVIALLGMTIMQLSFITGLAVGTATVVAVTMVASLTLLPALMGSFGARAETTRWRGVIGAGVAALGLATFALTGNPAFILAALVLTTGVVLASLAVRPLRRELPPRRRRPLPETVPYRWSRLVQRHPWPAALGATALLVLLAVPVAGMRLGFSDEGNYPEHTSTRRAYDLLAEGFGPGFNGPLLLAAEVPPETDPAALDGVTATLEARDGVAQVSPAIFDDDRDPSAVMWQVFPSTAPQEEATTDLVEDLRAGTLPEVAARTGLDPALTGTVAANADFTAYLAERMPVFLGAVLLLSFVLLMVVFRSVLVPLKAVVMNLLGIGSAFGLVVAGFQWGWAAPVLNIDSAPVEPFIPMMLFAIVFGLSMDYEVFLLSRIREEWDRTGDSHLSVADGLATTARVITAAALIMVFVFGAFSLGDQRIIKMFGLGLAVAVLLDATVIRMLLVPATMELLGDRNWWLPRWLDRALPRLDVEGQRDGAGEPGDREEERDRDGDRDLQPVG